MNGDETAGWESFTNTFTVPAGAVNCVFRLRVTDWIWQAYFDNVFFGTSSIIPPPPPGWGPRQDKRRPSCNDGPTLQWCAASAANGPHHVYLGTSYADVNDANTSDPEYLGSTPLETTSWTLDLTDPNEDVVKGQNYYWRVDAVGSSETWKGSVWTFRSEWDVQDPNIRLWHKFDEEPPSTDVIDWSGHEFHGTVSAGVAHLLDPNNGRFGGCRIWTAYPCTVTPAVFSTINSAMSISLWLKDIENTDDNLAFEIAPSSEMRVQIRAPRTTGVDRVRQALGLELEVVVATEEITFLPVLEKRKVVQLLEIRRQIASGTSLLPSSAAGPGRATVAAQNRRVGAGLRELLAGDVLDLL